MHGLLRFSVDGTQYVLIRGGHAGRPEEGLERVERWEFERLLTSRVTNTELRIRLQSFLAGPTISGWNDHRDVARRAEARQIDRVEHVALFRYPRPLCPPLVLEVHSEQLHHGSEALVVDTWIEVRVTDDYDEPYANIEYEIDLTDGSTSTGKTDDDGRIFFDKIPAGTCRLKLPDLDDPCWEQA